MDEASFEVWMSETEGAEFQSVMRANGLTSSSTGPLHQRSPIPSDGTVIVAVSGAIYSITKAFTAYFQSKEKCIKVSTLEGSFYVKNYTPSEVAKIAKAGNHIVLTTHPKELPADDV